MAYRVVVFLLLAAAAFAQDEKARTLEQQRAYAWFARLGYPDVAKLAFVRVFNCCWEEVGDEEPRAVPDYGFLIEDRGAEFSVFTLGLWRTTLTKTSKDTPRHMRVGYEKIDLAKYVRDGVASLPELDSPWTAEPFGYRVYSPRLLFRLYVLAYGCAAHRHFDEAHQVWELARMEAKLERDGLLPQLLKNSVAREARRMLCEKFADPRRSWVDHMQAHWTWRTRFSAVADTAWVDEAIPILDEMTRDAQAPQERIAALIRRLPETRSDWDPERNHDEAARVLVDIGLAAAPRLIAAMDDKRFTRCTNYTKRFKGYLRPQLYVSRVGRVARSILVDIAGRYFENQEQANAWWQEVQEKGEERVLREAVVKGGQRAALSARVLVRRYPDRAASTILEGLAHAKETDRSNLARALRAADAPEVDEWLAKEIHSGPTWRAQLAAAWMLLRRGNANATRAADAMIALWKDPPRHGDVAQFLLFCGSARTVRALWETPPPRVAARASMALALLGDRAKELPWVGKHQAPPVSPGWNAAVEELLVRALDDTEQSKGNSMLHSGVSYYEPRVCDVAAHALARRFPERYRFDKLAPLAERDRARAAMVRRWREARK